VITTYDAVFKLRANFLSALNDGEHGTKRSALLRLAILSSGFSKLCGFALQALAIPLLYHSLGQHRYDLYMLFAGALATIGLAQMGAGPGLTQGLAKANASGNRAREAALLAAAFRVFTATALVAGASMLFVFHNVPPERLFGPAFAADRHEIWVDGNVCVAVLALTVLAGVVDSALAGYQEQVFIHLGSAVSNIMCIGLLFVVCRHGPTLIGVIVVLYGVPMLPRAINLIVLSRRRPYLFKAFFQSSGGSYGLLLNAGVAFWGIEIASLLEQNCGTYELAHLSSIAATALFAVAYKGVVLAGAVVSTVTVPLWPAYTDAIAHRDVGWIRRSHEKIRRALMAYSCAVAVVIVFAGQWIFTRLLHVDMTGNRLLFAILGVYFISSIWTHLLYVSLMGVENMWKIAMIVLAENLLLVSCGLILVPRLGAAGMALAYLCASLALPVWLLPRMWHGALTRI
jgi:O-antigen/teichoic acid export membrane protein